MFIFIVYKDLINMSCRASFAYIICSILFVLEEDYHVIVCVSQRLKPLHDSQLWLLEQQIRLMQKIIIWGRRMQLNHVWRNSVVSSRVSSWMWFGLFCQQSQQDTNGKSIHITSAHSANSCRAGGVILFCM